MMLPVYIWGLLPLFFLLLVCWSLVKNVFGLYGKEPIRDQLSQLAFCLATWGASYVLVSSSFFERVARYSELVYLPEGFLAWLVFPLVLFLAGILLGKIKKSR